MVMEYLATFHTHFDAVKYCRFIESHGGKATLRPVPRKLSSSCGSCVVFSIEPFNINGFLTPDLDELYYINGDKYELIGSNQ